MNETNERVLSVVYNTAISDYNLGILTFEELEERLSKSINLWVKNKNQIIETQRAAIDRLLAENQSLQRQVEEAFKESDER